MCIYYREYTVYVHIIYIYMCVCRVYWGMEKMETAEKEAPSKLFN